MLPQSPWNELSDSEREILRLLGQGYTQAQIAQEVGYSLSHIEKLLSRADPRSLYAKIGVRNQREAVAWYKDHGGQEAGRGAEDGSRNHGSSAGELVVSGAATAVLPLAVPSPAVPPGVVLEMGTTDAVVQPVPWRVLVPFGALALVLMVLIVAPGLLGWDHTATTIAMNFYVLIPAVAGVYGLGLFQASDKYIRAFGIFASGLLLWATGALIWGIYDLQSGPGAHYTAMANLAYLAEIGLQLASFAIWWRLLTRRRAAMNPYIWAPLAAALLILHLEALLAAQQISRDGLLPPIVLAIYVLFGISNSASLAMGLCMLLPSMLRLYSARMKVTTGLMAAGMVLFYTAGILFTVTAQLPEGHQFRYPAGGSIDLAVAAGLTCWGIAIALARSSEGHVWSEAD